MRQVHCESRPCAKDDRGHNGHVQAGIETSVGTVANDRILPSMTSDRVQGRFFDVWCVSSGNRFVAEAKCDANAGMNRLKATTVCLGPDHSGEEARRDDVDMVVTVDATRDDNIQIDVKDLSAALSRSTCIKAQLALTGNDFAPVEPRSMSVPSRLSTQDPFHTSTVDLLISKLKDDIEISSIALCSMEELVIRRLLSAWRREEQWTARCPDSPGNRSFRRAKAFIEEHIAEKLLVADVAKAAGVSVRRLQVVFQNQTGKTPMNYILDQRLNRVRAELRASTTKPSSINTTAARWGFTHMGDFSRRYRARFGEVPSLTRRR